MLINYHNSVHSFSTALERPARAENARDLSPPSTAPDRPRRLPVEDGLGAPSPPRLADRGIDVFAALAMKRSQAARVSRLERALIRFRLPASAIEIGARDAIGRREAFGAAKNFRRHLRARLGRLRLRDESVDILFAKTSLRARQGRGAQRVSN
jgi:hypothetical protein